MKIDILDVAVYLGAIVFIGWLIFYSLGVHEESYAGQFKGITPMQGGTIFIVLTIGAMFAYYLARKEEKEAEKEKQEKNQVKNDKDENKSIISSAEL